MLYNTAQVYESRCSCGASIRIENLKWVPGRSVDKRIDRWDRDHALCGKIFEKNMEEQQYSVCIAAKKHYSYVIVRKKGPPLLNRLIVNILCGNKIGTLKLKFLKLIFGKSLFKVKAPLEMVATLPEYILYEYYDSRHKNAEKTITGDNKDE